jgi:hypothetical protein
VDESHEYFSLCCCSYVMLPGRCANMCFEDNPRRTDCLLSVNLIMHIHQSTRLNHLRIYWSTSEFIAAQIEASAVSIKKHQVPSSYVEEKHICNILCYVYNYILYMYIYIYILWYIYIHTRWANMDLPTSRCLFCKPMSSLPLPSA